MKKGLRRSVGLSFCDAGMKALPDEEGIETSARWILCSIAGMKALPDEEGIETPEP